LADVCKEVGASTASVSRALNNMPGVGAKLKQRILTAVKELNYVPKAAARNLSSARNDTLGIVFQDLTAGWLLTVFRGIMSQAIGRYHILTALSTRFGDEFELPRRLLAERRIGGLIWLDTRATVRMVREMAEQQIPIVVLQRRINVPGVSTVVIEGMQGAAEATRHLLRLGYRRLVVIAGQEDSEDSERKMEGVRQALQESGIEISPDDILRGHHVGALAVEALSAYLAKGKALPEAILAFNDDMAIAVLNWLRKRGVRVPEDVALVGFDGIPEAEAYGLTTVDTPMYEMGMLATQLMIEHVESAPSARMSRNVILNGTLHIRETCGAHLHGPKPVAAS